MVFLPGDHVLDMNITVANVTRLTMRGESSSGTVATIVCSGSVGLSFKNMAEFKVDSLVFTSCSGDSARHSASKYALLLESIAHAELVTCSFHNNNGNRSLGGAIYASHITVLNISGTNNFINNSAEDGGAIYVHNTRVSFSGTNNFINNVATGDGGAIYASHTTQVSFSGNSNFINNSAARNGGAIYTSHNTQVSFSGTSNFISNVASFGGKIYTSGGVIYTSDFKYGGGGVYMGLNCFFSILPNTTLYWENNHAAHGGAIYVVDASPLSYCTPLAKYVPKEKCFFQLPGQNLSNGIDVQLVFKNNSATIAGSVLYGGVIDNCLLIGLDSYGSGEVFDMIVNISDENTDSKISSVPLRICHCENNYPDCSKSSITHPAYAGETISISVVGVGQRNGKVSAAIQVTNVHSVDFHYHQNQNPSHSCAKLNYTASALPHFAGLEVYADGPCSAFSQALKLGLNISQSCPPGLKLSELVHLCVCEPRLAKYAGLLQCNITSGLGQITRCSGQRFWVGYDQAQQLIIHPFCPFDYCVSHKVVFPLNDTNIQCAYNRSSLLCGACKEGYSLVLGTSHCKQCSNSHLVLLIPLAVMGVALVFLLLVCKLTVAKGTLSGLMFYANIVGVNRTIFLPVESTDPLSVFIAWLNLDFGIETCFYNGLDAYSKTWLQFVFPVYIWLLVGLIILVSNFSHRFAKLLGNNPVSVLATLILLSYTKILRTLITALYITFLEYPAYNRWVWLYDANIDYLSGKHILLFIVAVLVFLFLFLPYTLLLLFGQWLQAISHLRLFSWINRLKPFMDSYHAPYKAKHRYWPGLLLMLRFALLLALAFEFNSQEDTSINLLAILVVTGVLQLWAWASGGVYKNWCLDALEGSFALNLIILVGATSYVNHSHSNQLVVGYTSVSIALATFIGILGFQLANVTGIVRYLNKMCETLKTRMTQIGDGETETESDTDSLPDRLINPGEYETSATNCTRA